LVEVNTLPLASTATHRVTDGHETDCMWVPAPRGGESSIGPVLVHVKPDPVEGVPVPDAGLTAQSAATPAPPRRIIAIRTATHRDKRTDSHPPIPHLMLPAPE
jgi:hypothetical protein